MLAPYKYAGYPALVKTIQMETHDDSLFSKAAPLLVAASELAFHTVNCSALNAQEMRREGGIEVRTTAVSSLVWRHSLSCCRCRFYKKRSRDASVCSTRVQNQTTSQCW